MTFCRCEGVPCRGIRLLQEEQAALELGVALQLILVALLIQYPKCFELLQVLPGDYQARSHQS